MLRSHYILGVLVPQIKRFDHLFTEMVFPSFADPEAQAEKVAQDYWNQKMSEPCGENGPDEDFGDIADNAHQESLDFYFTMTAMHTTVLNLFAAGLYHLFEQQAGTWLRDWTGKKEKYPIPPLMKKLNLDPTTPLWARLNELKHVANVVKHAEGDAAAQLRVINPAYFQLPAVRGTELEAHISGGRMLGEPLTGEGLYVTKADYDAFVQAVIEFWRWVAGVVG